MFNIKCKLDWGCLLNKNDRMGAWPGVQCFYFVMGKHPFAPTHPLLRQGIFSWCCSKRSEWSI